MTSQKPSTDLSKQQILESIGRIVAEGEGREPSPDDDASPEAAPTPEAAGGEDEDDILDLVDMVDEKIALKGKYDGLKASYLSL